MPNHRDEQPLVTLEDAVELLQCYKRSQRKTFISALLSYALELIIGFLLIAVFCMILDMKYFGFLPCVIFGLATMLALSIIEALRLSKANTLKFVEWFFEDRQDK